MTLDELRELREEILAIAARHGASNVRVLGSVARGEAGPDSDVDLLVDVEPGRSWRDHVALYRDLEHVVDGPTSLITANAARYWELERVLLEAVLL